jgi:hypothetical protein
MIERFREEFPDFYQALLKREKDVIDDILPPASQAQIDEIEQQCGVPLPNSYKSFLRCCRGMMLLGGRIQFGMEHPFFHDFPPLETLNEQQLRVVDTKGGNYPPPSQGMLCFAEFFMEADGDQVLWDVSGGMVEGEYPIYYYCHEDDPPSVRKLSDNFKAWLREFLNYEEFERKDQVG